MTFEWPLLLLVLGLIPALLALYLLSQWRRRAYTVRFTNLALLREVVGRDPGFRRHLPALLFLLGLAALLVSLARPHAVIALPRDEAAVMLVLDVSGSMEGNDMQPNRLEAAKQAASAFLDALPPNARVGLVSFSSSAALSAPLTDDAEVVRRTLAGLTSEGGTAIGEGLRLAVGHLSGQEQSEDGRPLPGLVVLLSDGEQTTGRTTPDEAAAQARDGGIAVHTVGIGQRGAAPRVNGGRQQVRLDEATLQRVAEVTGGQYFYAAESSQLEQIYADLGSHVSWIEERTEVTALASGLGAVLLLAAGLLSLRWFQRLP